MIEAFFKSRKHRHLFYHDLKNIDSVNKRVEFYLAQHNEIIPQNVLGGATPLEVFSGNWTGHKISDLNAQQIATRAARRQTNLSLLCGTCQ